MSRNGFNKLRKLCDAQKGICWLCGELMTMKPFEIKRAQEWNEATLDHIVPRSVGGINAIQNLKAAHASCNRERGAKMHVIPQEFWYES